MSRPRISESVFRALADPKRRRIIELLHDRECVVGELMATMRLNRTVASYHLGLLMEAGIVRQQRRGTHRTCVLEPRALDGAQAWLARYSSRTPAARSVRD